MGSVGDSIGCPRLVRLVEVKMCPLVIVAERNCLYTYGKQLEALGVKVCRGNKTSLLQELVDAGLPPAAVLECPALASPQFCTDYKKPTAICHLQRLRLLSWWD